MANKKNGVKEKKAVKKSEDKPISKKEEEKVNKNYNKILINVFVIIGVIALVIIGIFLIGKSATKFTYQGVKFQMVKEGDLIFYSTALPVMYEGALRDYNFYIRNDARKLNVPFNGTLDLKSNAVLNMEQDFKCDGKGLIGVANLLKLYKFIGINVISDKNATCDTEARYTFIQILEGSETKIEQTGQSCYNLYVSDCEILEVTEKLMIETLVNVNKAI